MNLKSLVGAKYKMGPTHYLSLTHMKNYVT